MAVLKEKLGKFPAVALVGPRQAGKTTLAKELGGVYFDLEQEEGRVALEFQWHELMRGEKLVVLDEAQEYPDLFKRLRGAIDEDRKKMGRFLLLGSVSPGLMQFVSESLAGRMALVELTPFLWEELAAEQQKNLWLYGGYPDGGVLQPEDYPDWQIHYLDLLTARDLPNWGLAAQPKLTQRLLKMLAVLNGQTFNGSQIGRSLDLSYKTVSSYLDYLEGAFLIRRLPPYHANLKKRLIKSPKIYWRDSGLLHALMNIHSREELYHQPWAGVGWEGFVIEQVIGHLRLAGKNFEAYYLRTSDQYEVDLIVDFGKSRWAIEVKLTAAARLADLERLEKTADMIQADKRILISRTEQCQSSETSVSCNLPYLLDRIDTE